MLYVYKDIHRKYLVSEVVAIESCKYCSVTFPVYLLLLNYYNNVRTNSSSCLKIVSSDIYLLATGSLILPFGSANGDTFLPSELDTSSSAINFSNPFPFLGTNETSIYVSSNNSYDSWI